jgi:hypothetical protein
MKTEKYRAKVRVYHDQLGKIEAGDEFEATAAQMTTIKPYCDRVEQPKKAAKSAKKAE